MFSLGQAKLNNNTKQIIVQYKGLLSVVLFRQAKFNNKIEYRDTVFQLFSIYASQFINSVPATLAKNISVKWGGGEERLVE